jgi:hypothetical protein
LVRAASEVTSLFFLTSFGVFHLFLLFLSPPPSPFPAFRGVWLWLSCVFYFSPLSLALTCVGPAVLVVFVPSHQHWDMGILYSFLAPPLVHYPCCTFCLSFLAPVLICSSSFFSFAHVTCTAALHPSLLALQRRVPRALPTAPCFLFRLPPLRPGVRPLSMAVAPRAT